MSRTRSRRPAPSQLPLSWHPPKKVCHHWAMFRLTCDQFDAMHWRAQGRCEICQRQVEEVQKTPLGIDHDHRLGNTIDHVRGLLCAKCNRAMCYVDNGYRKPTEAQVRYIQNSWFWQWLPPHRIDQPYFPETCRSPSGTVHYRTTPAYARVRVARRRERAEYEARLKERRRLERNARARERYAEAQSQSDR